MTDDYEWLLSEVEAWHNAEHDRALAASRDPKQHRATREEQASTHAVSAQELVEHLRSLCESRVSPAPGGVDAIMGSWPGDETDEEILAMLDDDPPWIEGFPTEPGDYWFYRTEPGYPGLTGVTQGRTSPGLSGLIHKAGEFLHEHEHRTPVKRIWHKRLVLPSPPVLGLQRYR